VRQRRFFVWRPDGSDRRIYRTPCSTRLARMGKSTRKPDHPPVSPSVPCAPAPASEPLLDRHLRRCLPHLGVGATIVEEIVRSASLEIAGVSVFLRMLPSSSSSAASDTTVALVADLSIESSGLATADAALRWNACATLSHGCAVGCTDSGAMVLLQAIDLCGMDDMALAAVLRRLALAACDARHCIDATPAFPAWSLR